MEIVSRLVLSESDTWPLTGLACYEGLRANNISHAVTSEKDSTCELFLGVASNIGGDHCQTHAKSQALEVTEPERYKAAPLRDLLVH